LPPPPARLMLGGLAAGTPGRWRGSGWARAAAAAAGFPPRRRGGGTRVTGRTATAGLKRLLPSRSRLRRTRPSRLTRTTSPMETEPFSGKATLSPGNRAGAGGWRGRPRRLGGGALTRRLGGGALARRLGGEALAGRLRGGALARRLGGGALAGLGWKRRARACPSRKPMASK